MEHYIGERVIVSRSDRTARGWLESADDTTVVVRLPSDQDPEKPGDRLETFACVKKKWVTVITCTSVYDHHGVMIGYVDPTWSRNEDEVRRWCTRKGVVDEIHANVTRRVRELSLSVPLAEASIWNDFGRLPMREQALDDLGLPPSWPRKS